MAQCLNAIPKHGSQQDCKKKRYFWLVVPTDCVMLNFCQFCLQTLQATANAPEKQWRNSCPPFLLILRYRDFGIYYARPIQVYGTTLNVPACPSTHPSVQGLSLTEERKVCSNLIETFPATRVTGTAILTLNDQGRYSHQLVCIVDRKLNDRMHSTLHFLKFLIQRILT